MGLVNSQKYSKALLEVAQEKNQVDEILAEVKELNAVITSSALIDFFQQPVHSDSEKLTVAELLKESASPLMKNFLATVAANGRLADLQEILQEVLASADESFKISEVEVTSSVALTDAQKAKIITLSKEKFDLNEVTIKNTIDEKILGGFIINSRGKIIDASIKTQLAKIASQIL